MNNGNITRWQLRQMVRASKANPSCTPDQALIAARVPAVRGRQGLNKTISHKGQSMFFFFSSKLGCLGSIVVSLVLTLLLLLLFGVI